MEAAGSKQQYLTQVFILTFISAFKHRYFSLESALLGRADRHRRNKQIKLLIPRARQAVGRCLADQHVSKCSRCSVCSKDLNYTDSNGTEISAWSAAHVQHVLLSLSGQVCYQNRRKVLGLQEHSKLPKTGNQPKAASLGGSYLPSHTEIRRAPPTAQQQLRAGTYPEAQRRAWLTLTSCLPPDMRW